jgi:hypothetical protein
VSKLPILKISDAEVLKTSRYVWITIYWVQYGTRATMIRLVDSATGAKYEIRYLPEDDESNADAKKMGVVYFIGPSGNSV